MINRCYSDLKELKTFEERYNYLKLFGNVAEPLFGHARYLNQKFYNSRLWKEQIRNYVIVRDYGCEMGLSDYPIQGKIYVHHMNPITKDDLLNNSDNLIDPEYMISLSFDLHQSITFGEPFEKVIERYNGPVIRTPFDTCPWRI